MTMSPRERVLTTLRRERPDQVPKDFDLSPALREEFGRRTGRDDVADYFRLEARHAGIGPTTTHRDFSAYFEGVADVARQDEWGVGYISAGWDSLFTEAAAWRARGYPVLASPPGSCGGSLFETAWYLRGQEQLLIDFHDDPDLATALLDTINNTMIEGARRMAQAGVDVLRLGDDVGSQRAMLMSPNTWRKWLKPRLAALMRAAREIKRDILIFYHSDGDIRPIIPDLIEIGLDVLNPVQPECMDPVEIRREYGDRLAFWGTIGTQTTMPHGTAEEVRRVVKERIETVGPEGLLLAPTHVLEPDVPWDNVVAFVEAVEEHGRL
jgi:uroporphyrinogen decarboxylase